MSDKDKSSKEKIEIRILKGRELQDFMEKMHEGFAREMQRYAERKKQLQGLQVPSEDVHRAFDTIYHHFIERGWLSRKFKVALNYMSREEMAHLMGPKYGSWVAQHMAGFVDPLRVRDGHLLVNVASDYWKLGFSDKVVIAHEMVHVEQYARGDLKFIDGQNWWRGIASTTFVEKGYTYEKFPWEAEAFERMYPIVEEIGDGSIHPKAATHRRKGPQLMYEITDMMR